MTDKEVMQMALDALEQITPDWRTSIDKHEQLNNSIEALRACLTKPEPYDQTELALCKKCGWKAVWPDGCLVCEKQEAQSESEPVATLILGGIVDNEFDDNDIEIDSSALERLQGKVVTNSDAVHINLFTAPQHREWVGLTDGEYELMAEKRVTNYFFNTLDYAHDIEAKLKGKNT